MALTKLSTVLNKIASLPTLIKAQASTTKGYFDYDVNVVKDYINNTLTSEIETQFATKTELSQTVLGQVPDNSLTEQKMANDMKKDIVGGIISTAKIADNLVTDDATFVLSAKQGKALNDNLAALTGSVIAGSGITLLSVICRKRANIVNVALTATLTSGSNFTAATQYTIGTLASGFYPLAKVETVCASSDGTTASRAIAQMEIGTDGVIKMDMPASHKYVSFNVTYII